VGCIDASYQIYQGEYYQALKQVVTAVGYMAVPTVLGYVVGIPYIGFLCIGGMTAYAGYSVMINSHSFYQEYMSEENELKSAVAYRDLFKLISESLLQHIYDFDDSVRSYDIRINNLMAFFEKAVIKAQLEEKGEFGQKLYEYIYAPSIEEKYVLANKILQGELTEIEAEGLKAKHITLTLGEQSYEHCVESNNSGNSNKDVEHYYCYNDGAEVLDHITIRNDGNVEVIEHL